MEKIIKKREFNIDLLRIISMIMVLVLHYLGKGGLLEKENVLGWQYVLYWVFEVISIIAVNCYVLISGYFSIKSEFKIKKFLYLWGEVLFFSIIIYLILLGLNMVEFNIKDAIISFFPVLTKSYWFITVYLVMYLISPFINILINGMNKKQYRNLLIILIVIFSVLSVLPAEMSLDNTGGYSITWFICLYLIGGYINLHISKNNKNKLKYLLVYFGTTFLNVLSIFFLKYISEKIGIKDFSGKMLQYNNILVFIQSLSLFMFFREIEIKNEFMCKCIKFVAPLTFGVYIIHEQTILRRVLYFDILHIDYFYNNTSGTLIAIISIILLFMICIIIDYLRKLLFYFFEKNLIKYKFGGKK